MTSHRIGVNLRVSGNCDQGGRKYMEDTHAIKFEKKDNRDYEFAYFGIFDGHGGPEASLFARDNLLGEITKYDQFWSDNDDEILLAIKTGFLDTHQAMWRELDKWPRTVSGLPSTSGTTASIAIVKKGKLYIGHVGDSGIVLGCDEGPKNAIYMKPKCLTKDHKPDNPEEKARIESSGGSVVSKAGVQRVVWSRPKMNHKGPVRRSTQIDMIPFLAVARSLGDLWSYDYYKGKFVVSPEPDVSVMKLEPGLHRCLVLGSDGLWNMVTPEEAVSMVTDLEMHFEDRVIKDPSVSVSYWINPAERLVARALNKWRSKLMKADNITCIVVLIDPLGPSKLTILRKRREEYFAKLQKTRIATTVTASSSSSSSLIAADPSKINQNQSNSSENSHEDKDVENSVSAENKTDRRMAEKNQLVSGSWSHSRGALLANSSHNNSCSLVNDSGGKSSVSIIHHHSTDGERNKKCPSKSFVVSNFNCSSSATFSPPLETPSPHSALRKMSSASKIERLQKTYLRGSHIRRRLSQPMLGSYISNMDDSVQVASALIVSPSFHMPLSPALQNSPACSPKLRSADCDQNGGFTSKPPRFSSVPTSESLMNLLKFDIVQNLIQGSQNSNLNSRSKSDSILSTPGKMLSDSCHLLAGQERRKYRHSDVAGHAQLKCISEQQQTSHSCQNKYNSPLRTTCDTPQSLDCKFKETSNTLSRKDHLVKSISSSVQKVSCTTVTPKHKVKKSAFATNLRSAKKVKNRRDFSLLHRTRSTLRRAKRAACKVLCPENRSFFRQLPGVKRKHLDNRIELDTLSVKRQRRSV